MGGFTIIAAVAVFGAFVMGFLLARYIYKPNKG